jgi:hypothetical protein
LVGQDCPRSSFKVWWEAREGRGCLARVLRHQRSGLDERTLGRLPARRLHHLIRRSEAEFPRPGASRSGLTVATLSHLCSGPVRIRSEAFGSRFAFGSIEVQFHSCSLIISSTKFLRCSDLTSGTSSSEDFSTSVYSSKPLALESHEFPIPIPPSASQCSRGYTQTHVKPVIQIKLATWLGGIDRRSAVHPMLEFDAVNVLRL